MGNGLFFFAERSVLHDHSQQLQIFFTLAHNAVPLTACRKGSISGFQSRFHPVVIVGGLPGKNEVEFIFAFMDMIADGVPFFQGDNGKKPHIFIEPFAAFEEVGENGIPIAAPHLIADLNGSFFCSANHILLPFFCLFAGGQRTENVAVFLLVERFHKGTDFCKGTAGVGGLVHAVPVQPE